MAYVDLPFRRSARLERPEFTTTPLRIAAMVLWCVAVLGDAVTTTLMPIFAGTHESDPGTAAIMTAIGPVGWSILSMLVLLPLGAVFFVKSEMAVWRAAQIAAVAFLVIKLIVVAHNCAIWMG